MRLMDLSIRQLWWYIGFPFRKLKELWNRDPEWADDIPEDATAEEEPEFLLPEQHAPKIAKVHRRGTVQPQPEPAAAEPAPDADIPDFVAADQPLPSELDDMIRNSYSQPQDDAPIRRRMTWTLTFPFRTASRTTPRSYHRMNCCRTRRNWLSLPQKQRARQNRLLRQHRRFRHVPTRSPASTFCRTVSAVPATLR